jgi:hypothetical protein
VHIADADPNGNAAESYTHGHNIAYPNGSGYGYTYGAVYGYTYTNRKPKLHAELHIHRGDGDDRSGHNRYRQSLR